MATFVLGFSDSDFLGGTDFNKFLETSPETANILNLGVNAGTSETNRAFTRPGQPGAGASSGTITVEVNVTTGSTSMQISVQVFRINSSLAVQAQTSISAEQTGSAGVKTFTFNSANLGTFLSTDRIMVEYTFRSTAAHGNTGISIETGTVNTEVTVPVTQAGISGSTAATNTPDTLTASGEVTATSPFLVAHGAIVVDTTDPGEVTPVLPAHQAGDVIFVEAFNPSNSTISATAGWTAVTTTHAGHRLFWKRATSSSETAPTITCAVGDLFAKASVVRNVRPSGVPYDDFVPSSGTNTLPRAAPFTTVDTVGPNRLLMIYGVIFDDVTMSGYPPSGWTSEYFETDSNGTGGAFYCATQVMPDPGAAPSAVQMGTLADTEGWVINYIAVAPATSEAVATEDPDTATFSGNVNDPAVAGTVATTEPADTPTVSGKVTIVGTISVTDQNDFASSSGDISSSGSVEVTETDDTSSASGAVGDPPASGTLELTENPDTTSMSGEIQVRKSYYSESLGESANNTTNWQDKVALTFTPEANTDYWVFWSCRVAMDDHGAEHTQVRLQDDTAAATRRELSIEFQADDPLDQLPVFGIDKFSTGTSPSSQTFSIEFRNSVGTSAALISNATLFVLRADPLDQYVESEALSSTTNGEGAGTPFVDKATLTFTPPTQGDYLVIASAELANDGGGVEWVARLRHNDTDDYTYVTHRPDEHSSSSFEPYSAGVKLNLPASEQEFRLQWRSKDGIIGESAYIKNAAILALRLDKFAGYGYAESRALTTTTSTAYVDKVTLAHTPDAARNHVVMMFGIHDHISVDFNSYFRLTKDGAEVFESTFQSRGGPQTEGTRGHAVAHLRRQMLSAVEIDWALQYRMQSGAFNFAQASDAAIAILDLGTLDVSGLMQAGERVDTPSFTGTVTGTVGSAAIAEVADTPAVSGSVSTIGTSALTEEPDTITASGDVASEGISGTLSVTEQLDTLNETVSTRTFITDGGLFVARQERVHIVDGGFVIDTQVQEEAGFVRTVGSASVTEQPDASNVMGDVAAEQITGTLSVTENDDTPNATAVLSSSGSFTVTESVDTLAATGGSAVEGSLSITEGDDTPSFSGSLLVSGSFAVTEGLDFMETSDSWILFDTYSVVPQLTVVAPSTMAVTESGDTAAVSGTVASTGTLSVTEQSDISSATSSLNISGSLSETEDADTLNAAGEVLIDGSMAETENVDTPVFSGVLSTDGSIAVTENSDTQTATGTIIASGTISVSEESDIADFDGLTRASGALSVTEDLDTPAFTGTTGAARVGTLSRTESADTPNLTGGIVATGTLVVTEDDDSMFASADFATAGSVEAVELDDTLTASGALSTSGAAAITENDDTLNATAKVLVTGSSDKEEQPDTATITGNILVEGSVVVTENDDVLNSSGALLTSGASSVLEDRDVPSISASFGTRGTVSVLEDDDTIASEGKLGIVGTTAVTAANDDLDASGRVDIDGVSHTTERRDIPVMSSNLVAAGSVAVNEQGDDSVFIGKLRAIGSMSRTAANDDAFAAGVVRTVGTLAVAEDDDLFASIGIIASRGSLVVIELGDISDSFSLPPSPPPGSKNILTGLDRARVASGDKVRSIGTTRVRITRRD